jgi:uncharacterized protein YqhQ
LIRGGSAGRNSVTFYSDHHHVKAIRTKENSIEIEEYEFDRVKSNLDDFLMKIPLIRGIWVVLESLWRVKKAFIIALIVTTFLVIGSDFIFSSIVGEVGDTMNPISVLLNFLTNEPLYFIVITIVLCFILIKFSDASKYHAAEHIIAHAYENGDLSIDQIIRCRYSRIHINCGTNLVVFFITFYSLLFVITEIREILTLSLLSYSLAYEVFIVKAERLKSLLMPFYYVGFAMQYLLFTSRPTEHHLEVALACMKRLKELEGW